MRGLRGYIMARAMRRVARWSMVREFLRRRAVCTGRRSIRASARMKQPGSYAGFFTSVGRLQPSDYAEIQPDVGGRGALRQAPDRDIIHAAGSDRGDGIQ